MASRSRHLTRDDVEGRFKPPMTAAERERAEQLLREMYPVPSDKPVVHVDMPPVFGAREAAPWLGLLGIGGT